MTILRCNLLQNTSTDMYRCSGTMVLTIRRTSLKCSQDESSSIPPSGPFHSLHEADGRDCIKSIPEKVASLPHLEGSLGKAHSHHRSDKKIYSLSLKTIRKKPALFPLETSQKAGSFSGRAVRSVGMSNQFKRRGFGCGRRGLKGLLKGCLRPKRAPRPTRLEANRTT